MIALILLVSILVHDLTLPMRSSPQSLAIGRLRKLARAQKEFQWQHGCFASELNQLSDVTSRDPDYVYAVLSDAHDKQGCITKYIITASPVSSQAKGFRYFSIDETETLRSETAHAPGLSNPVLQ